MPGKSTAYGETFSLPTGDISIKSIQFEVNPQNGGDISFFAAIYTWNGSAPVTQMFMSGVQTVTDGNAFAATTVNTLNTVLSPTPQQYIAYFTTVDPTNQLGNPGGLSVEFGSTADSAYTGGTFYFNNGSNLSTGWQAPNSPVDLAFRFTFNPLVNPVSTPEPATAAMALIGLLCVGGRAGYRRLRSAS